MNDLLKFITCGSVDDGKSTLIGHLLYDAKLIFADQKEALLLDSKVGSRGGAIDYSLLLDGLLAEREQGITIDVAYRYFTTDNRSFICADTPGHEEYTRNMACGASFADLAIILVDATQGVLTQTRRHARICALMGIRYFIFAVNKMDLVNYDEKRFYEIEQQIDALKEELGLENVLSIPVSATEGDNITKKSSNTGWYQGPTLLNALENTDISKGAAKEEGFYLPVQRVCRPNHEFRGFQGQIESGEIHIGDTLTALPSGEQAEVKSILVADHEEQEAFKGQPVTIQLNREIDVSRGSVLTKDSGIALADSFTAEILWMDDQALAPGRNFLVKLGTKLIPGILQGIEYRVDVNTGEHQKADTLSKNEIAVVKLAVTEPIPIDRFSHHRTQGELILIDRISNMTSAGGVVLDFTDINSEEAHPKATPEMRSALNWQHAYAIAFAQDDVSLADLETAEFLLVRGGRHTYLYAPEAGEDYEKVAQHLVDAGLIVLVSLPKGTTLREDAAIIDGTTVVTGQLTSEGIAAAIQQHSMLNPVIAPNNWVI